MPRSLPMRLPRPTPEARRFPGRRAWAASVLAFGLAFLAACGGSDDAAPSRPLTAAGESGRQVAEDKGCLSCHTTDGASSTGPTWAGLAGSTVSLDDGQEVTANDAYLRRAILDPRSEVVEGYANIMPTVTTLTDADVDDLLAYLHDLGADAP